MRVITTAMIAALFVSSAAAQTVTVTPSVGRFTADKPLGLLAPDGPQTVLRDAATASIGLEVGTGWPFLSIRATASTSLNGSVGRREPVGFESCGQDCSSARYDIHPLKDGASIMNLAVSTVLRPFPHATIRPHLVVGGGLKRIDLGRGVYFDGGRIYSWGGRSARFALNVGAGVSVPLGMTRLELEAIDYVSGFTSNTSIASSFDFPLSDRSLQELRHDFLFTAGLRVRVR